jgi:hypothetical protein
MSGKLLFVTVSHDFEVMKNEAGSREWEEEFDEAGNLDKSKLLD